ncbi:MAG TPA: zinc-dependent metalloprotease [Candidatus Limnocylindrales bacterium]|nr:zinc-dependent metalloprotease [Candidatus Limnocylindrales bacterium]
MKWFATALLLVAVTGAFAQDEPAPQGGGGGGRGGIGGGAALTAPNPQPFDRVITKNAKSKKGLFTVHQIGERFYYEIPKSELGKQYLWNTQIAKTTAGVGYGGGQVANRVVAWELRNDRVYLRDINFSMTANPDSPISEAVRNANNATIILAFNVAAYHDGDPVIDVSRLLNADVPEFSARQQLGATAFDATRSFIDHVATFPDNVEAEVTATYTRAGGAGAAAGGGRGGGLGAGAMRGNSASVVLHHSMVRLPEKPMMPRLFDERVGYFTTAQMDFTADEYRAKTVRYIARWRLEKKDPNAAMSEPVKPIVYYIDAATPKKWVPWLKKGVEDWNEAFAAAGFKNAIIAKEAPTAQQDPDWSPEDVRHSVIRWLPSTVENASGPHISDPRTGEILNADIQFYNNVMNLARDWYFVQVGPLDPRAQKLPLPDDLMGRLLEYVVCHEVGHTLGFQHNMKASSMYPADKIRDKEWVHKMGHTPSIMDYSRFNYVAQPEDGIAVEDLIPRIGPYDVWATKWGYSPLSASTPQDEKATLDKWAREQDTTPWLRFSTPNAQGSDPGEETEAVGDADPVKSTALGMKNLQRVAKMLMPATTWKEGETYEDLGEVYGRMLSQWQLEMNHVASVVGGFNSQEKVVGQEGRVFTLIPKIKQQEAVKFIVDNALSTPVWMVDPEILRRIEATGALTRIRNAQGSVLNTVLNDQRFARLIEQQTIDGTAAYTAAELLSSVRKGVWKELDGTQVKIDAYRRNLQNEYLDLLDRKINGMAGAAAGGRGGAGAPGGGRGAAPARSDDEKPFYRAELKALNATIASALPKATDHDTKAHLEAAKDQIQKILDPKFLPPAPAAAAVGGRGGAEVRR